MNKIYFLILLLIKTTPGFAQSIRTITPKAGQGHTEIRNFRISRIRDDRTDTSGIGATKNGVHKDMVQVRLSPGAATAIGDFINSAVKYPEQAEAMELHILELKISDNAQDTKNRTDLHTRFAFFRNDEKLLEYSGDAYVQTKGYAGPYLEKLLGQSIENTLLEFDNWWADHKEEYDTTGHHIVSVSVELQPDETDPDQIAYDIARPLVPGDFGGMPDKLSMAQAMTYSGFSLSYQLQGERGRTHAVIEVTPYFDKTRSWMKKPGKDNYILLHEQLHFDITALKTYALITALRHTAFSAEGFKGEIDRLQKQYSREMQQMQAQYDQETGNGSRKEQQQRWVARIKNELQQQAAAAGYGNAGKL